MKTRTLVSLLALLALFSGSIRAVPLGTAFTYQGRLQDGSSPANGTYDLSFALYDAAEGGGQVGPALTNAPAVVSNGLFTVTLDFGPLIFSGQACWLQVGVRTNGGGAFTELTPRQPLTPAPYAIYTPRAGTAASALSVTVNGVGTASLQANAVTSDKIAEGTIAETNLSAALVSNTFWRLGGNGSTTAGSQFLGTTDNQPLELKVQGERVLRLEPGPDSPNLVGGYRSNRVDVLVSGATIGGGGSSDNVNLVQSSYGTIGGGSANAVWADSDHGTIAGGSGNSVQSGSANATVSGGTGNGIQSGAHNATIAGGAANVIESGAYNAAIGGGFLNTVKSNAVFGVVPGGLANEAAGAHSLAAGRRAKALHQGAFVWADSANADFASTDTNQFLIRARGGVGIGTDAPQAQLHVAGDVVVGGTNFTAPDHTARLVLGDGNHVIRSVYAGGIMIGTWPDPNAIVVRDGGNVGIGTTNPATKLEVVGLVRATELQGDGSGLTGLNASEIRSGTLPEARLSGYVSLLGNSIESTEIADGTITAIDVTANTFWQANGNSGTGSGNFLGTTDNQPLELRVNGQHALRLQPDAIAPVLVGGYSGNNVGSGSWGSVIAGGGEPGHVNSIGSDSQFSAIGGGEENTIVISAPYATIGGGYNNMIEMDASDATIGGGELNMIQTGASDATIGGGISNTIQTNALNATIGGGWINKIQTAARCATIAGGELNTIEANARDTTISGGGHNLIQIDTSYATIGGGMQNTIQSNAYKATIGGGSFNTIQTNAYQATIAGGDHNMIESYAYEATIAGGAYNTIQTNAYWATIVGGDCNRIQTNAHESFIGGGAGNRISAKAPYGTIGGGWANLIDTNAYMATIGGGEGNYAGAEYATVPGGQANMAMGSYSFATGRRAKAHGNGSFVWSDANEADLHAWGDNQFVVRATGGYWLFSAVDGSGIPTAGATLAAGSGTWGSWCDRNAKANCVPADPRAVLDKVAALPIASWNYKAQDPSIRHIGPMAQDFHAAFGVGDSDKTINTVDADGVALAAIQGLNQKVEEREARIQEQAARIAGLEARLEVLEQLLSAKNGGGQ